VRQASALVHEGGTCHLVKKKESPPLKNLLLLLVCALLMRDLFVMAKFLVYGQIPKST